MGIKQFNNTELLAYTHQSVQNEREATTEVLHCIREIEARRLFAQRGYSCLIEMLVKEFKFSHGSASRRISAMRLLREIPEIETKVLDGSLTLTQLSQAQIYFNQEKKENRAPTIEQKTEILQVLENKTSRETEVELLKHTLEPLSHKREIAKTISPNLVDLRLTVSKELHEKLEVLKNRLNVSRLDDLLEKVSGIALKATEPQAPRRTAMPAPNSRHIPVAVRFEVRKRDQYQCQYKDPTTHRRCQAKRYLEFDHKIPWSMKGPTNKENIQLLCSAHNKLKGGSLNYS